MLKVSPETFRPSPSRELCIVKKSISRRWMVCPIPGKKSRFKWFLKCEGVNKIFCNRVRTHVSFHLCMCSKFYKIQTRFRIVFVLLNIFTSFLTRICRWSTISRIVPGKNGFISFWIIHAGLSFLVFDIKVFKQCYFMSFNDTFRFICFCGVCVRSVKAL